eukprot:s1381_g7.t1
MHKPPAVCQGLQGLQSLPLAASEIENDGSTARLCLKMSQMYSNISKTFKNTMAMLCPPFRHRADLLEASLSTEVNVSVRLDKGPFHVPHQKLNQTVEERP